jgi:hypothetical protein
MSDQRTSATELEKIDTLISQECDAIKELLRSKNKKYGNSAFNPVRIFSKSSTEEQINVRIDDKLSRISQGYANDIKTGDATAEDTVMDLIGYLILKRIKMKLNAESSSATKTPIR